MSKETSCPSGPREPSEWHEFHIFQGTWYSAPPDTHLIVSARHGLGQYISQIQRSVCSLDKTMRAAELHELAESLMYSDHVVGRIQGDEWVFKPVSYEDVSAENGWQTWDDGDRGIDSMGFTAN